MGPIDFSKFDVVVSQYISCFDFDALSLKIAELKADFPQAENYLEFLSDAKQLEEIVKARPSKILEWKGKFEKELEFDNTACSAPVKADNKTEDCTKCNNCKNNHELRNLSKKIIEILGYEGKGKNALRKVYSQIGLKTCYICNAQYALTIAKELKEKGVESTQIRNLAKYQFDHYLPKSIYPCFSISLYNLFPICSSCNSIKGNDDIGIDFYSSTALENAFYFKVIEDSLTSFLLHNGPLKIDFIDNYKYAKSTKKISERFDIKGIYNTQLDLIEDLIYRKLNYSDTYKNTLSTSFPEIFSNTTVEERIKLGTYSKIEGIHKRPMSKFLQDIESQLEVYFEKITKEI